jgi:tungstate transport system permease protein
VGVTMAGIQGLDPRLRLQILSLGASRWQLYGKLVLEARVSLLAALAAGFGAVISEVGAVMIVGGNIEGQTRVMTTAIVQETRQGNLPMAIALSLVLLALAVVVNGAFTWLQQRRAR